MLRVSVTTSTSGIIINDAYTETTIKDNDNGNLSSNKVYMLTSFCVNYYHALNNITHVFLTLTIHTFHS